jgi:hypothetical protein
MSAGMSAGMSAAPPRPLALGGGGHLRVLLEALRLTGRVVEGILDADPAPAGVEVRGVPAQERGR